MAEYSSYGGEEVAVLAAVGIRCLARVSSWTDVHGPWPAHDCDTKRNLLFWILGRNVHVVIGPDAAPPCGRAYVQLSVAGHHQPRRHHGPHGALPWQRDWGGASRCPMPKRCK